MMLPRSLGFILLISSIIWGNTYYIDYAGGADANSGTSASSPWKRCPGMAGFSAAYTHSAGDVFIFKGGVVWPSAAMPFAIANSGAAGKIDSYTTDHSWYSGSAWAQPTFDGQLFGQTLFSATGISSIRINDLRFINAGLSAANGIIGIRFLNCSSIEVSGNTFATESWGTLYITAERTGDFYDILVHHNDISHCAFALRIVPAAASAIFHNVQIYNNAIHDFHSQLSGAVHGDGIQHYCSPDNASSSDRYIDGFKIYNNRFYGDFSQAPGTGGAMTALVYLSSASIGVQIYNNVFTPQYSGSQSPNFFESFISLRDNPNRGGHHKIYNNTFASPVTSGQSAAILEDDTRLPAPGLDIKNNIFVNFRWPFDLRSTNHTIDYNSTKYVDDMGKWAGNFVGSFSAWQALGLDVHGMTGDPGFVSSTDRHLASNSPCIGKGANLSADFTTDCEGKARPSSGGFSMGAYETGSTPPPAPPSAPTLSSPAAGATDIAVSPTLSWNAAGQAASYSVQVSTGADFSSAVANGTGITATSYTPSGLLNVTTYYWRVNASNASGTSAWSSARSFTTVAGATPPPSAGPALWWPADGADGVPLDPSLTWAAVSGAAFYTLQVASDTGFSALTVNKTSIDTNSFDAPGLANGTKYYWRVNYTAAFGTSAWSSARSFTTTTAPTPPPAPVLWWPGNDAVDIPITLSLSWSPGQAGASCSLQVATESGLANPIFSISGITTNSCNAVGLSNATVYFWRVKSTNGSAVSAWSASGKFTTIAAPSPTLTLLSPTNGTVGVVINPSLAWSPDPGARSYSLQVSADSSFVDPALYKTGITANSFEVSGLVRNVAYFWRVRVVKESGASGWTPMWKFTVANEGTVGSQMPIAGGLARAVPQALAISSCQNGAVQLSLPQSGAYSLSIFSANGQMVCAAIKNTGIAGYAAVPLKGYKIPKGFYVLRLSMRGMSVSRKVFIVD
jgi:hypothetical protein